MRAALVLALVLVSIVAVPRRGAATPCILSSSCADGDLCNGVERCVAGECQPAPPLRCDDGDPCTRDVCDPAIGCTHPEDQCPSDCTALPDGTRCADGSLCTRGDACMAGACVPGTAVVCDDGDACTRDSCDPGLGCVHHEEAVGPPCAPDCNGAAADYTPCPGDDDICTLDGCLPSVDLIGNPHMCIVGLLGLERPCQDGDVCNGAEYCSPVLGCQPGPPLACDDGDACNGVETCDAIAGCQAGTPQADGTSCDDHHQCTSGDACAGGTCVGTPLPPAACDDGDPLTSDTCEDGFGCLHCVASTLGRLGLHARGAGDGTLSARGLLPPGGAAGLAPASERIALFIEDGSSTLLRADLDAGALLASPGGKGFAYRDRRGAAGPLRSLRLQRRNGTFKWSATAGGLTLPASAPASVTVRLVIGDDCFAAPASCAGGASATCH